MQKKKCCCLCAELMKGIIFFHPFLFFLIFDFLKLLIEKGDMNSCSLLELFLTFMVPVSLVSNNCKSDLFVWRHTHLSRMNQGWN